MKGLALAGPFSMPHRDVAWPLTGAAMVSKVNRMVGFAAVCASMRCKMHADQSYHWTVAANRLKDMDGI